MICLKKNSKSAKKLLVLTNVCFFIKSDFVTQSLSRSNTIKTQFFFLSLTQSYNWPKRQVLYAMTTNYFWCFETKNFRCSPKAKYLYSPKHTYSNTYRKRKKNNTYINAEKHANVHKSKKTSTHIRSYTLHGCNLTHHSNSSFSLKQYALKINCAYLYSNVLHNTIESKRCAKLRGNSPLKFLL